MAAASRKLRGEVNNAFKFHGLKLRPEASEFLVETLAAADEKKRTAWIEKIISLISEQPRKENALIIVEVGLSAYVVSVPCQTVDENAVRSAVEESSQCEDDSDDVLFVIDAFGIPKFEFDVGKRKFVNKYASGEKKIYLHGGVEAKANLYLNRYHIVHQRALRHEMFSKSSLVEANQGSAKYKDKFYLEDPTGTLELDLTDAQFHVGLFSENSIVLVEGWHQDRVLHVSGIGFPPNEAAHRTREHFGNLNFFGGPGKSCAKSSVKLREREAGNPDATLCFASDIWLDVPVVLERLRMMFEGFSESPPVCFVFCGSFLSRNHGKDCLSRLHDGFVALTEILKDFDEVLQHSSFIFVPSLRDPVLGNILPRPGLPRKISELLMKKIPRCYVATNPCRIQYCTQEIVVFREDLVEKMCRNCVRMPNEKKEIPEHFAKTILSQSHLCPLPVHVAPVYWEYEHALRLYPLPDLVLIADKYDPFVVAKKQGDTIISNPGSFSRNKFSFQVYIPASKTVEESSISD